MEEPIKKAFDFAQESTKQIITLSTGVIALTITFSKDFATSTSGVRVIALWSWVFFLLSVLFGLWTLLALTGSLEPASGEARPSIRGRNVTLPSALQILMFFGALVLTVVYGACAIVM